MYISSIVGRVYRHVLKPVLFCFNPEHMHEVFVKTWDFLWRFRFTKFITRQLFQYNNDALSQTLLWIHFSNPVGLAAWFDKDIQLVDIMWDVWFGREECGSITYGSYEGNPWKRLYRLVKSQWIVVNYWLKSKWIHYTKDALKKIVPKIPLFVSVAKTNCTETCELNVWIEDYVSSLRELKDLKNISGFVLNISCPNSFGGEDYTTPDRLAMLLSKTQKIWVNTPIFVKLPVDKPREDFRPLIQTCVSHGIQGVIIANLTKKREHIIEKDEIKGLPWWISGKPTQQLSDDLIGKTYQEFGDKIIIVWVGGIFSAEDAYEKIKQGATLVQLITGMIFQWPQLIGEINSWLVRLLQKDGFTHISQAIGKNCR